MDTKLQGLGPFLNSVISYHPVEGRSIFFFKVQSNFAFNQQFCSLANFISQQTFNHFFKLTSLLILKYLFENSFVNFVFTISRELYPNIVQAAAFHDAIITFSSIVTVASVAVATIDS